MVSVRKNVGKMSLFRIAGISYFNTTVTSLVLVFTIYLIFYAITLCFIMFICPFVGPLIGINKILSYLIIRILSIYGVRLEKGRWPITQAFVARCTRYDCLL